MRVSISKLFFILLPIITNAQKHSNVWYFGPDGAGLDFNNCEPIILTNGWTQPDELFEGSVSICDDNGNLLFYTGGRRVINRNHFTMQNGENLGPATQTMTQNLIIKKPGNNHLYYIISPEIQASGMIGNPIASIIFAVVDMSLDGGLGGVISYGNILKDTLSARNCEKLTVVKHSNNQDLWIITHEYDNNNFLVYYVSQSGINTTPVISSTGPIISSMQGNINTIGELKASPNGKKLAFTTTGTGTTGLFDFDNNTGIVSNPIQLSLITNNGESAYGYGVSFSANSRKLYISNFNIDISGNHYQNLVQFDISSNDSLSIQNSITLLFTSQTIADRIFSLKLAPNKKIYCGRNNGSQYIGVINFPDSNSAVAQYQHNGIYLYGLSATWGLNNSMELSSYCGEEQSTEELTIPNIFTPNNDGINDVFEIKNLPKNANVQIYNRWGALIFESSSPNNFWNGKTKIGSELNEGVYFYIITLPGNERKTGFVQLIR